MSSPVTLRSLCAGRWRGRASRFVGVCCGLAIVILGVVPAVASDADAQLQVAAQHFAASSWELAGREFDTFLEQYPDDPRATAVKFYAGEALMQRGKYALAAAQFEQLLTSGVAEPWARAALFRAGEAAYFAAAWPTVVQRFEQFDAQYPRDESRPQALIYHAYAQLQVNEPSVAAARFRLFLVEFSEHPRAVEARAGLAVALRQEAAALLAHGDYTTAIVPLLACLEADGAAGLADADRPAVRLQLVACLARAERWDAAEAQLRQLPTGIAGERWLVQGCELLAAIALEANDHDRAIRYYQILRDTRQPAVVRARGVAGLARLMSSTDRRQARELVDEFLASRPAGYEAAEVLLVRAQIAVQDGEPAQALSLFERVLESDANVTEFATALGAIVDLSCQANDVRRAAAALNRVVDEFAGTEAVTEQERAAALARLVTCELALGEFFSAHLHTLQLSQRAPGSPAAIELAYRVAEALVRAGKYESARTLVGDLLSDDAAQHLRPHLNALEAQAAGVMNDWFAAHAALEEVLESNTESLLSWAQFWRAELSYRQGRWQEAGDRFADLSTTTADSWHATAQLRRVQLLVRNRRWPEALAVGEKLAAELPEFAGRQELDYLVGRCLLADGRLDDARQSFQRAVTATTDDQNETAALAQWMIGETYLHQRQYESALEAYRAVERFENFPRWRAAAWLQAGKCCEALGQLPRAADVYHQLLSQYPNSEHAAEARRRVAMLNPSAQRPGESR